MAVVTAVVVIVAEVVVAVKAVAVAKVMSETVEARCNLKHHEQHERHERECAGSSSPASMGSDLRTRGIRGTREK